MSLRKPSGSKEGKQLFLKNNSILNLKTFSIKKKSYYMMKLTMITIQHYILKLDQLNNNVNSKL